MKYQIGDLVNVPFMGQSLIGIIMTLHASYGECGVFMLNFDKIFYYDNKDIEYLCS